MFFAKDESEKRIYIGDAEKDVQYYCPICNQEVIQRRGEINLHHFAHKKNSEECDSWTNDMSDWHREWQECFPSDCREVVIVHDGEKHRADVLFDKTVIEFQHSRISPDEFEERNVFYEAAGYKVVWLFDMIDEYESERIIQWTNQWTYKWKYHWHTFDGFDPKEKSNVTVYFQFDDTDENSYGIEQLSWIAPDNGKFFATKEGIALSRMEFIEMITMGEKGMNETDESKQVIGKPIPVILRESSAAVVGVRNIKSGVRAKVANLVRFNTFDCKAILGRLGRPDGTYYDDRREVYYSHRAEWVVEWERGSRAEVYY